ncbi:60S ribosomal protein L21 [Manis javanica]|nr:60S ribosomal protein L21 [Manis javanica]
MEFLWPHTWESTRKVIIRLQGNRHCSKRNAPQTLHGIPGRVYSVTQHAPGTDVNEQVKGKILAKRINVL